MSTHFMNYVLRLCDRLFDKSSAESIDRQGKLNQVLVVVLVFHLIMGISFVKMEEYEKKHPRVIRDVDISFLCSAPAPVAEFRVGEVDAVPKPIVLTPGISESTGAEARQKARATKQSLNTVKAKENDEKQQNPDPVHTRQAKLIDEAPVSITPISPIKADPSRQAKSERYTDKKADAIGNSSTLPASGSNQQSGDTRTTEDGDGTGGRGPGGAGSGRGDQGVDNGGQDNVGNDTPISRVLAAKGRAMGDLRLYMNSLEKHIRENWKPSKSNVSLVVNILIDKEGNCMSCEVIESSGSKRVDQQAVDAIESTSFEPLPDWYKGNDILFQYTLNGL